MKLKKDLEDKIKKAVLEKIGNGGRRGWDIPHILCAVKWVKKLIQKNGGDEKVLIPAMYFHDSCYPSSEAGYNYEKSMDMKKMHAKRGADFSKVILNKIGSFSREEIKEIYRLVKNHDIHDNIKDNSRQLVFEADGLAQLDWKDCPPNFDKENCLKWIKKYFEIERPLKRWKTKFGKRTVQKLRVKANNYWK